MCLSRSVVSALAAAAVIVVRAVVGTRHRRASEKGGAARIPEGLPGHRRRGLTHRGGVDGAGSTRPHKLGSAVDGAES